MRAWRFAAGLVVVVSALAGCAGSGSPAADEPSAAPSAEPSSGASAAPTESAAPDDGIAVPDDEALEIRYADGFEIDESGWTVGKSTDDDGVAVDLGYRDGAYEMNLEVPKTRKVGASYRSFAPDDAHLWTTVEVSVDARKAGDAGPIGVLCFEQADEVGGGYDFLLDGDGTVAIIKRAGNRQIPLAEDVIPDAVHPRGGNKLRVQCFSEDGDVHLRLFVNDQELMRTVDAKEPLYRRGGAGVLVSTGAGGNIAAAFDDFLLRGKR